MPGARRGERLRSYCEAHDTRSNRCNECIRDLEDPAAPAPQLLPFAAAVLGVHALCNVSGKLQMLHLQTMTGVQGTHTCLGIRSILNQMP